MAGFLALVFLAYFSLSGALHHTNNKCHLARMMHLVSALDQPFISSGGQTSPVTEPHAGDKCTSIALELPGWGMLSVRGDSRLEFLHGLSTNSFKGGVDASSAAVVGSVIFTAFANAQGRLISFCRAIIDEDEVQLLCDPGSVKILFDYLNRFIFPSDRVEVVDVSSEVSVLSISLLQLDPKDKDANADRSGGNRLEEFKFHRLRFNSVGQDDGSALLVPASSEVDIMANACRTATATAGVNTSYSLVDSALCVVKQSAAVPIETRTLLPAVNAAVQVMLSNGDSERLQADDSSKPQLLSQVMFGEGDVGALWWDCARRAAGRPVAANEINYNVTALECGLMHGLHFRKGCYVGQETISKTVSMTSNAVRRRLCALSIKQQGGPAATAAALAGDAILDQDGDVVGVVTSGSGVGSVAKLPPLRSLEGAAESTRTSSHDIAQDLAERLERYVDGHCLALLKTSYAIDGAHDSVLSIQPKKDRINGALLTVAAVHSLSYATFDKKYSPCPPLDRGSKSSELLLLNDVTAMAMAGKAADPSPALPSPSPALSASAEADRKAAKMLEMAKKVAALKARQQKGSGSQP